MSDSQSDGVVRSEFIYWSVKRDEALVEYLEDPTKEKRDTVMGYSRNMDQHGTYPSRFYANTQEQLDKLDQQDENTWLHLLWNAGRWYSRLLAVSPYKGRLILHVELKPGGPVQIWGPGLDDMVLSLLVQSGLQQTDLWESHMVILPPIKVERDQFNVVKIGGRS